MHLYFEQNTSAKCDCTIMSLSWMGKVPDELPEDEGWKLNRTNYYQEGWLATGNVRGIVGVTFTSSHCRKNAEVPLRTNYNLRGHRSEVILVKWNEPYQKLASCDSSGVIFVWIKYEGRWSIELINDRNTPVTHFSWSHDGRMALICYRDGFVLVGSVAGQRYWSSMLNLDATITCGIWTPDDQQVYFGTTAGQIIVMDVHGAMVSQVQLNTESGITNMAWSCEKFKMEEGEDTEPGVANASERSFVLAVSFYGGQIYLLKNYDDVSPVHIETKFDGRYMAMEWSNSRELLAVAGSVSEPSETEPSVYSNMVKFYSDSGVLLYCTPIPGNSDPVSAMTWGHNDRRVFVATGSGVQVARAWRRLGSLQLLARLRVRTALRRQAHLSALPLPPRLAALVATLFTHTISCCVPEASAVREFVSRAARSGRLHCTMLRRSGDTGNSNGNAGSAGVSYTLYLEHLGGLVPLLKGRRTSKIRPEFVIYDPQYEGADLEEIHWFRVKSSGEVTCSSSSSGNSSAHSNSSASSHVAQPYPMSDSSDTDKDEGCSGSPRLQRRKKGRHRSTKSQPNIEKENVESVDELAYIDSLPEDIPLVEVTSNIWGTKFKIHGLAKNIPANLGQVTYKTSLLHLQPRQMTLVMTELRDNFPTGPDPNFNPNIFSEDEEEVFHSSGEYSSPTHKVKHINCDNQTVIAPMSPRGNILSRGRSGHLHQTTTNTSVVDPVVPGNINGSTIPALARAESYEDEFPYIDLTEMVNFCESLRINGSSKNTPREMNLMPGTYSRNQLKENGDSILPLNPQMFSTSSGRNHSNQINGSGYSASCGVIRSNSSSSSQRSSSSHCPGRHAISPLCCEGSVPTLQSPKNAVAPSDIIFDRPPAQTMMSYHNTGTDFSQNIQQMKSNISTADCHNHQPTINFNLSLDHNRQLLIKKMETHLETTIPPRVMNGCKQESTPTQNASHSTKNIGLPNNLHHETYPALFKQCNRKEKSPSPSYDNKRDDMKYIDEESIGTFPSEVSMESSCSRKYSALPISPAGVPVGNAPIADKMIRSCSVGYLDIVQSQLVPCEVTLAMLRKEAPKRLVLVTKKNKTYNRHRIKKQSGQSPGLNLNLENTISENYCNTNPYLKTCGKSRSLDSTDMLLITSTLNDITPLPTNLEESSKSIAENKYETIDTVKSLNNNSNTNNDPLSNNIRPNKNAKEFTKLSFFTNTKNPVSNKTKKRDLPVCDICKCVTITSNPTTSTHQDVQSDNYICNACIAPTVTSTPKKSKGLFKDRKQSSGSDKSRSSSPRLGGERYINNASEIEIERATTPSPVEHKSGNTLSGAALATLEQLLYRVSRSGFSGGDCTPPPSPAARSRLPRSSPASPAPSKKNKRTASASPIRKHILNSPLLNRRRNKSKNQESSDDELGTFSGDEVVNGKNYRDLETFQKAQLRQKLKRGKIEPVGNGGSWGSQPSTPVRREFVMHNKAPMWNESSQVYQLDFGGRVTQESAKNFQIEFRGKQVMQFGRIDGNAYTLDFQYPFSALQAFAVALANVTQRLK